MDRVDVSAVAAPREMRAMLWRGPGRPLTAEIVPTPQVEDGWDVVVRVRAAVFGAALVRAATVGHPRLTPPAVLGTLIAGDVVSAGAKVQDLSAGTPITVDPHPPCRICANCLAQIESLCLARPRIEPGGLAEYVRIRPPLVAHIRRIPEGVSYASAAYAEIVACAAESILVGGVGFGDTVVVVGCGPVALLHIQLAKLRGATRVICLLNHPERKAALVRAGAVPVDIREGRVEERVKDLTGGRGAEVVVEAVGRAETYALALRLARPGGTVVGFGGCPPGTSLSFDPNELHYHGIHLIGSYHYAAGMFERALRLLAAGRVDVECAFTHRLPLARIAEAPAAAADPDCFALIIEP